MFNRTNFNIGYSIVYLSPSKFYVQDINSFIYLFHSQKPYKNLRYIYAYTLTHKHTHICTHMHTFVYIQYMHMQMYIYT